LGMGQNEKTSRALDEGDDNSDKEDDGNLAIIPWTNNAKKMNTAKKAMALAAQGGISMKISTWSLEEQRVEIARIGRKLLHDYHLHADAQSEDLRDLPKLIRYKVARSWLPPLILQHREMTLALDEQKVNTTDRRKIHLEGIKFCLQGCERILFSLTEFMLWEEEGLAAMWSIEESCQMPPATKRFLPHRLGEVDENARTPRDEDDAEVLAPVETQDVKGESTRAVSFAESGDPNDATADEGGTSQALGASTGVSHSLFGMRSSGRLTRNVVRSRNAKSDPKGDNKLRTAAREAHMQAANTMTMSLHFNT